MRRLSGFITQLVFMCALGGLACGTQPKSARPGMDVKEVYEFYEVEQAPEMVSAVQPEYPEEAIKSGMEGKVTIQVIIDENGKVMPGTEQVLSSTNEVFNAPALEAARECRFTPGQMGNRKVKVRANIPFAFKLM